MRIQHNITALNASNKLASNQGATSKNLEKLSSGYRINRAGDDAAGLAISEKMRGQIRGLDMAGKNAQDGISLIQTAEGGLNETHSILQRMRELAVQSSNGTYKNEVDRENIDKELGALKSEVDRIASATHYNGINLLDGSLGGAKGSTAAGPKFGAISTATNIALGGAEISSNIQGVSVIADASSTVVKKGQERAEWNDAGTELTMKLAQNTTYTQKELDDIIASATMNNAATANKPELSIKLSDGFMKTKQAADAATTATAESKKAEIVGGFTAASLTAGSAQTFKLTSNQAGSLGNMKVTIKVAEKEDFKITKEAKHDTATAGEYELTLQAGKEYTADDITKLLQKNGLDLKMENTNETLGHGETITFKDKDANGTAFQLAGGAGLGNSGSTTSKEEMTFQIGANGRADQQVSLKVGDMSTTGIGINKISFKTRGTSNDAINIIDDAINTVSGTRADLGALQNRLEHTVSNLTTTSENLTAAESRIRDVDMAKEMMQFTKNNILSQAAQSMLAQANQQPQGVLQLLQ